MAKSVSDSNLLNFGQQFLAKLKLIFARIVSEAGYNFLSGVSGLFYGPDDEYWTTKGNECIEDLEDAGLGVRVFADDNEVVHKTGTETIAGQKIFSSTIEVVEIDAAQAGFGWIMDGNGDSVQDALDSKQAMLVSGTNIKTINNQSLLGSGNITISSIPTQTDGGYVLPEVVGFHEPTNGTSWALPESDLISTSSGAGMLADDSKVVHKTGNEIIDGIKQFTATSVTFNNANSIDFADDGLSLEDYLDEKQNKITISSSEPTSSQGQNGDIWIVI